MRNQGRPRLEEMSVVELARRLQESWETNRRLHRRCQASEHDATYYRQRYEAIQRPLQHVQDRAEHYTKALKALFHQEFRTTWRYCLGCRLTWRVRQWVRRHL